MAEWRDRGFVPDSDEEDESQGSTNVQHLANQKPPEGDDSHDPNTAGLEGCEDCHGKGNVDVVTCLSSEWDVGQNAGCAGKASRSTLTHDEDIDELQEDYYRPSPATKLRAVKPAQKDAPTKEGQLFPLDEHLSTAEFSEEPRPKLSLLDSVSSKATKLPEKNVSISYVQGVYIPPPSDSLPSSPLSEVSSLSSLSPSLLAFESQSANVQTCDAQSSSPRLLGSGKREPLIEDSQPKNQRRAMNLRLRKAIQVHPYAIEGERYRQFLHARGLKSLRLAQMDLEINDAEDSQNQAFTAEDSQDMQLSSPPIYSISPARSGSPAERHSHASDDEFPDVNAIIQNPSRQYASHDYKRRKINTSTFKRPPILSSGHHSSKDRTDLPQTDDSTIFEVPPSPPQSGSQTPAESIHFKAAKFHIPRRYSATTLPTPVTSSEPRRRQLIELSQQEDSDDQSDNNSVSTIASESSNLSPPDETDRQIERVQRKLRGVLPASWLKLDLKLQKRRPMKDSKTRASISPERGGAQRGVARPVLRPGSRSPKRPSSQPDTIVISDEDSSELEENINIQPRSRGQILDFQNDDVDSHVTGGWGEAVEDDRIDAMLPSTRQRPFPSKKSKRRQGKMSDFGLLTGSSLPNHNQKSRLLNKHQPRIPNRFDNNKAKPKPRFRPPMLSILDAPSNEALTGLGPTPHFLKLAQRTARLRRDQGRHDPSHKFIRLGTREDTNETDETLRSWREGTLVPTQIGGLSSRRQRRPLHPRSANGTFPPRLSKRVEAKGVSSKAPVAKLSRSRSQFSTNDKLQSSLDTLIQRRNDPFTETIDPTAKSPQRGESRTQRGRMISTLKTSNTARPAMLETLQDDEDQMRPYLAFRRDLSKVDHFENRLNGQKLVWDRFLEKENNRRPTVHQDQLQHSPRKCQESRSYSIPPETARAQRPRKRCPRQVTIPEPWSGQPSSPIILDDHHDTTPLRPSHDSVAEIRHSRILGGLGPIGTPYNYDFGITPIPSGTCFHQSTFLGSGEFRQSLKLSMGCTLDGTRGHTLILHGENTFRWGPWNDCVSSEMGDMFGVITDGLQRHLSQTNDSSNTIAGGKIIGLQRQIIGYFSHHLSFLDPVDRISFLQKCSGLLSDLFRSLNNDRSSLITSDDAVTGVISQDFNIQANTFSFIIAHQLHQLSQHEVVPAALKDDVSSMRSSWAKKLLISLRPRFEAFSNCLSNFRRSPNPDLTLQENHALEALIMIQTINGQSLSLPVDVWEILTEDISIASARQNSALMERCWQKVFTLLPYLEFDSQGVLELGRRYKASSENWNVVKRLVSPVLEVYMLDPRGQGPSFNSYCRALFSRCLHLITAWGWHRCDSIIGMLFDFFARNNLSHLRNEESHGSPPFLEQLDKVSNLHAEPADRCFHIFLKIIGTGLKHLRQAYPEKKIRDMVWRLMPNHGRYHPKDESIRQEDLDALRNHHDLLVTLYWASPPGFRPRLTAIRNLVHIENSHREACHINIKTWSNLIKYQLSTDEPTSSLEPFIEWHDDLLQQIVRQHSLARTEAEEQVNSVQHISGMLVSKEVLESTITKNQRQVEAVLSDALISLQLAVEATRSIEATRTLLSPVLASVFSLFDSGKTQTHTIIVKALEVLSSYSSKMYQYRQPVVSLSDNEDSQDYGDWTGFDEDMPDSESNPKKDTALQQVQEPLRQLLSNCFGADQSPGDELLLKLVQVWAAVGKLLVKNGSRSWNDYIGRFGNDTWTSLRDTEQTRKFTSHYLALLIDNNVNVYEDNKSFFLASWIRSLVERESQLKFQHELTSALLNADCDNPLLSNLPFWRNNNSHRFKISPAELSERRLPLISSILSNMRSAWEDTLYDTAARQEYKDFLKLLMVAMKHNYQELGHGSNVRGAYVDFVHRVVEFLQQHTLGICPIDRFFSDNAAFPLPATDPTYVVGQLKNYGLRLQDPRTPKQLAIFLQSVSERAAMDGQQAYLVGQLHTAMSNSCEENASKPTLRAFLVKAILPAYIDMAFQTPCGYVLALPFLQALRKVFGDLMLDLDGFDSASVAGIASIITAFLSSVRANLTSIVDHSATLQKESVLKTITACFSASTALLPTLDYIDRLKGPTKQAKRDMKTLQTIATFLLSSLSGHNDVLPPTIDTQSPIQPFLTVRHYATQELRDSLAKTWSYRDGQYFINRGASRKELVVEVGLMEEEREELKRGLWAFGASMGAMPVFWKGDGRMGSERMIVSGMEGLFL